MQPYNTGAIHSYMSEERASSTVLGQKSKKISLMIKES
jgi:hypothetical protein